MNIKEIVDKKIEKIRLPKWNEWAYLKVHYSNGTPALPVKMWDIGSPGTTSVFFTDLESSTDWEEWTPPKDFEERQEEIYKVLTPPKE